MTETVKVAVRVRPFNSREINRNAKLIIGMNGKTTTIQDPENPSAEPRKFAFDYSYWSHDGFKEGPDGYNEPAEAKYADQKSVFNDLGKGVLDNAWKGYNCSLFAYGQTGSGKSYSIIGSPGNKGIVPLVGEELFNGIDAKRKTADKDSDYQVTMSMLEIYNEQVRDLLSKKATQKGGLKVRQHPAKGFYVESLTFAPVNSFSAIENKMNEGTMQRTIASTNMNATSSRAHTIVAMSFTQKETNDAGKSMTKTSIINIIDLAGSERAESTGATGDRLKEGSAINKSLSTLGNCIKALADQSGGNKKVIVPFRDSVLTKLLNNALGGNSKTVMVAALSPADINYDETLSTLKFADRAKAIKTSAVINESPTDKLIRELREENTRLMEMLKAGGVAGGMVALDAGSIGGSGESAEVEEMKRQMEETMAANQRELEEMKKSYEERMKDTQADTLVKLEEEKKKSQERKVIPHFWNLSEDPALTAMIIHFCREGTAKVGNKKASPSPQILMNGLSILKEHATVTNKKGTVTLKPLGEAKLMVNGKKVSGETEMHHNDRVLFGANHMYVFHHPQDEAKQIKAGKHLETPTYDHAQEEIAQESGLMGDKKNMLQGDMAPDDLLLQEDLVQLLPMVSEANAMSEELDKKVKFDICLVSARARGLKEGPTEVKIKMRNLENGNAWLLDRNNFINRKYMMQEMYQNFMEENADWNVPREQDPFWEPHTTPVMIGTVHVYMQSLVYLIDMEENMVIMDIKGQETGHLLIEAVPCDKNWKQLSEDIFVEDPKELKNKPLYFKFKVKGARGIPVNYAMTYCSYKFYLEEKPSKSPEIKGTINPDYNFERQITFKSVTDQLIEYLTNDSVMVEVWGVQKEEGMKTGKEAISTKGLMQREKTIMGKGPKAGGGAKTPTPAASSGNDNKLANEIQEKLKKAKAKGLKSVPIEEIEETLAKLTGQASPAAAKGGNNAKAAKTSRACMLQ